MGQVVQLIGNPSSGRYRSLRVGELVRAFEDQGATDHYAECGMSPPPIRDDATLVCVAAGDGTVRHVASEVARGGHAAALCIYPAGTINLLAREAGYSSRAGDFAKLVLASEPRRRLYPVSVGQDYFFACAGVGPDSLAVARVSSRLKHVIGRLAYGAAFLSLVFKWPRHRIVLSCSGREIDCEAFYAAKGRYYAGGWSFAPQARLGEPVLHVVALRQARRRDYASFVWTLLRGRDQADGDIVGMLPATMTVAEAPLVFC